MASWFSDFTTTFLSAAGPGSSSQTNPPASSTDTRTSDLACALLAPEVALPIPEMIMPDFANPMPPMLPPAPVMPNPQFPHIDPEKVPHEFHRRTPSPDKSYNPLTDHGPDSDGKDCAGDTKWG